MTTKQLREWLFTHNQEDQWWLALDGASEEDTMTATEIDHHILARQPATVQALHISQASMDNPPWIDVDWTITAPPPATPRALSVAVPLRAPPPMLSPLPSIPASQSEALGIITLLVPLLGALLNVFWVGTMNLLQHPAAMLNMIGLMVVGGTAVLIGAEASQIGLGGPNDPRVREGKQVAGPLAWAAFTVLIWFIGFPAYMSIRSKMKMKDLLPIACIVMALYIMSYIFMADLISGKADEVREHLERLRHDFGR